MASHVKIDIYRLQSNLNKLDESIRKMETTFEKMESSINSLKSEWSGEAANEFVKYFEEEKSVYQSILIELKDLEERLMESKNDYASAKNELSDLINSFSV